MVHEWSRRSILKAGAATGIGATLAQVWASASAASVAVESVDLCAVTGTDAYQGTIKAIEQLGGMRRFVSQGSTVGLLINHQFRNPGAHVNPDVAQAVAALCWEAGARAILSLKDERFTYGTCQFFHVGHGKGGWYGDVEFLSQCVADLNRLRTPNLAVADATTILTTNGPFGPGKLTKPHAVVAGVSAVSVDAYCTRFLNITPAQVAMITRAVALGLGEADLGKVKSRELSI